MISSLCSTANLVDKNSVDMKGNKIKGVDVVGSKTEGALLILSSDIMAQTETNYK